MFPVVVKPTTVIGGNILDHCQTKGPHFDLISKRLSDDPYTFVAWYFIIEGRAYGRLHLVDQKLLLIGITKEHIYLILEQVLLGGLVIMFCQDSREKSILIRTWSELNVIMFIAQRQSAAVWHIFESTAICQHGKSYRSDLVQSLYNSTAQCATWLFPYNTYKYPVVWSAKDSPLTSGEQFFYQIVEHTRKPSYIRQLADTFQERYLNGPYIAFHYRYDAGEWSSVCARPQQGRKGEVCVVLEKTGSKGLALALTRFILQTNAFITGAGQKKSTIYVASPPTEAQKIKEVLNLAAAIMSGEGWTLDIVTTIDASHFLESEYNSCEMMNYKEEVLSLLEQELSYRGDYFIFSELSGWSANVRKERILDDKYFYEMSVIKLIEDFGPFSQNYTTTELYSKAQLNQQQVPESGGARLSFTPQN